jgi:hypothetical protein
VHKFSPSLVPWSWPTEGTERGTGNGGVAALTRAGTRCRRRSFDRGRGLAQGLSDGGCATSILQHDEADQQCRRTSVSTSDGVFNGAVLARHWRTAWGRHHGEQRRDGG